MNTADSTAAGGFARLPKAWLTLPVSPQAKMLLVAFCGYADPKGRSWFSYEQLGEILNRSKASVAAYVSELRESGVITCKKQTYGNGYNYRLLITVRDWGQIVAAWSGMSRKKAANTKEGPSKAPTSGASCVEPSERRIQPAERKDPSGPITNFYKTHSARQGARVDWTMKDEEAWQRFRPSDRDPITSSFGTPDPELLKKVIAVAADEKTALGYAEQPWIESETNNRLAEFVSDRRISASAAQLADTSKLISQRVKNEASLHAAFQALAEAWQPHWKRLSTPKQITETIAPAIEAALPSRDDRERAGRFMSRGYIAEFWLKRCEARSHTRQAA